MKSTIKVYFDTGGYNREIVNGLKDIENIKYTYSDYENPIKKSFVRNAIPEPQYIDSSTEVFSESRLIINKPEDEDGYYEDVREIFDDPDRMKEDIKHLGNAHRKGVDVFVTSDVKDIVSKREMIEKELGIKVFHNPNEIDECVNYIRKFAGQ